MHAETAYLFRHALLRDAAYQLQLPGDRGKLHGLALAAIEALCGGRATAPPPLEVGSPCRPDPHPTDPFAEELAAHAREAMAAESSPAVFKLYLKRAAAWAEANFRVERAGLRWREYAECAEGAERGAAALLAAHALGQHGTTALSERLFSTALEAFRANGDRRGEGIARQLLAGHLVEIGRLGEARETAEQARALLRDAGDSAAECTALAIQLELHDAAGEAVTRCASAPWHFRQSRPDLALAEWRKGVAILRRLGDSEEIDRQVQAMRRMCGMAGVVGFAEGG